LPLTLDRQQEPRQRIHKVVGYSGRYQDVTAVAAGASCVCMHCEYRAYGSNIWQEQMHSRRSEHKNFKYMEVICNFILWSTIYYYFYEMIC
jgi:hypothetical protein